MAGAEEAGRLLHWVVQVSNLRESLRFYELVFGLRVLRHEEFESGSEAEGGGPYGGAWSKTTVGWGPERSNFCLELSYAYGRPSREHMGVSARFCVACPEAAPRAAAFGYGVSYEAGAPVVAGPDGCCYKVVAPTRGRGERWSAVVLESSSLRSSERFWVEVLGMTKFDRPPVGCGLDARTSLTVGFPGEDQCRVVFAPPAAAAAAAASNAKRATPGRFACAAPDVQALYEAATRSGVGAVVTAPVTLSTPQKPDATAAVFADGDGYECAFLGDAGFYDLAKPRYDVVDFAVRERRGGDGHEPPAPSSVPLEVTTGLRPVSDKAALVRLAADRDTLVVHFAATWCKNCKKVAPDLRALADEGSAAFAVVDIDADDGDDIMRDYGVSSVPAFVFLKDGKQSDAYVGSNVEDLKAKLAVCFL